MSHGTAFRIGCPVWACEHWKGTLYKSKAVRKDWLSQYSSVFGTVEGNSTFYALPSPETARRWAESVSPGFRFCLKVPRNISHDRRLLRADAELKLFLEIADILHNAGVLGPSFIQLPPDFSSREARTLELFLTNLPCHLPWALEVRHQDWFDHAEHENWLTALLRARAVETVLFDSRALYSQPPADEIEAISQTRKPRTPIRRTLTGRHPFLRFIGRNVLKDVHPWITEWAPTIATWIRDGLEPFVFTHAPDDRYAPEFARCLYREICRHHTELPDMPEWPGEAGSAGRQKSLFD